MDENKITAMKWAITVMSSITVSRLGGKDNLVTLLVWLVAADFALGALWAIKKKKFSPFIAAFGFFNKMIYFIAIAICVKLDAVIGAENFIRNLAIVWFAISEASSVMENMQALGVPIPNGLIEIFVKTKSGFSIRLIDIVKQLVENLSNEGGEKHED